MMHSGVSIFRLVRAISALVLTTFTPFILYKSIIFPPLLLVSEEY